MAPRSLDESVLASPGPNNEQSHYRGMVALLHRLDDASRQRNHRSDMKRLISCLALAALLAGCSASVHGSGATSTVASSPAASTPAATTDSSSEVVATPVPDQCLGEVGQDTSVVVAPESTDTQIVLRCITGASAALDQTGAGETKCATTSNPNDIVYYWGSKDIHSADKHIYAGTKDGRIVIVPDEDSRTFWVVGGGLASVALATGCI